MVVPKVTVLEVITAYEVCTTFSHAFWAEKQNWITDPVDGAVQLAVKS